MKKNEANSIAIFKSFVKALEKGHNSARKQEWKKASKYYWFAASLCRAGGAFRPVLEEKASHYASLALNPPNYPRRIMPWGRIGWKLAKELREGRDYR